MSSIEELEASIDIVELVKRYANLKKAWTNYKALCPFPGHNEKTPSFVVSPSKQLAHCFWCRRWWWPLKFIMDVENCEFKEAIEILSSITWVKMKWFDAKTEQIKKNIYSIYKDIVNYYTNNLKKYPEISKYLYDRWLNSDSITGFSLWYSDSWLDLYNYLVWKWYDDHLIEESQVFVDFNTKKDKFIWRVIFPIRNQRWDFIALAWRVLWNGMPKYLNSSSSNIYDKSSILYWLFQARNEITKKDFIIITEWYMDCISLHQAGFTNTVCVSWTALTEKHIWIIKKLTSKIYLCFDWDWAWLNATNLSIEMLKNKDVEVKIINLWNYKDPDEVIKAWMDFNDYINNAVSPIWFYLNTLENTDSLQDKKQHLNKLLDIVKNYQDNVERDYYLKEISQKLDIKLEIVYSEFAKTRLAKRENDTFKNTKTPTSSQDTLVWLLLKYPEYFDFIKENIKFTKYLNSDLQNILNSWVDYINNFELDKKSRYLTLINQDEVLTIQAQTDNYIQKNDDNIKSSILKTMSSIYLSLTQELKEILANKIKSWDKEAVKDYYDLLFESKKAPITKD